MLNHKKKGKHIFWVVNKDQVKSLTIVNAFRQLVKATLLVEFNEMQLTIALKSHQANHTVTHKKANENMEMSKGEVEEERFTCGKPE